MQVVIKMTEALFKCQECGKKFYTVAAAERASNIGCPKCNGVDIDVILEWEK